jgi:PAS domain S-box-containing protein
VENWNSGAEFIKGYRASEILGKNFRIFYTEEDKVEGLPEKLLDEARRTGKAAHEGWRVRKNGTRFWGSISITAIHDNNGKVIGYFKVTRDLTERKLADDNLKIYTKELEYHNRELEQFAYVASHDLQEPLRKIQTFVEVIQRKPGDPNHVAKYFEKIKISANRMSELIRSVLKFSKLSRIEEIGTKVDLNQVLDQVMTDFEILILEKKAAIKSAHLPSIIGVQEQMIQLFTNLIANALKFTDKEAPVIDILSNVVNKDQIFNAPESLLDVHYAEIIVRDNGIGFDQQFSTKIFEMFQRLHGKNEFSGTGIGLALCKKIVENHKGYIAAHSEVGKGASFCVYLPLHDRV